jgi:hypothetical protein
MAAEKIEAALAAGGAPPPLVGLVAARGYHRNQTPFDLHILRADCNMGGRIAALELGRRSSGRPPMRHHGQSVCRVPDGVRSRHAAEVQGRQRRV